MSCTTLSRCLVPPTRSPRAPGRPLRLLARGALACACLLGVLRGPSLAAEAPALAAEAQAAPAPFDGPVQHARVSPVDYLHLRLECHFDWTDESVTGRVAHFFKSRVDGLCTITLDAVDLTVIEATDLDNRPLVTRVTPEHIEVDLPAPLATGASGAVFVRYRAQPRKGLYFVQPDPHYPERPRQVWTQGEPHEARHWYPCFDAPSERLTSEMIATVPYPLMAISNGLLKQVKEFDHGDHIDRLYHWVCEVNHVNYLISLVVGEYETIEDRWEGITIESHHYPGDRRRAELSFLQTGDMMQFFSERFGRYPYDAYRQTVVHDFHWGGMENIMATTLSDRTLHDEQHEPDTSSRGLVAHELAHQWFGNYVTCRDWSHIWLNESFATFCEALYDEAYLGQPDAQMVRLAQARAYTGEAQRYHRPLVCCTYRDPEDMFDTHSYEKGARVVEMLRRHLGDEAFFRGLRHYLVEHRWQSVETDQLRRALEEATGVALGRFFDDWVLRPGHPVVTARQRHDAGNGTLELEIEQRQDGAPYRLPLEIAIHTGVGEPILQKVVVQDRRHTITIPCPVAPRFVRLDRNSTLLWQLTHDQPRSAWLAQLVDDPDVLGRVFAAEELGRQAAASGDEEVVGRLAAALAAEPFWGVRREIAAALGASGRAGAVAALATCLADEPDSRVRTAAAKALGKLGNPKALTSLAQAFAGDGSDWVREAALRSHHELAAGETVALARAALEVASHAERVRVAGVEILERERHLASLGALRALAAPGAPRRARLRALEALGRLGSGDADTLAALCAQVDDPHTPTRRKVLEALGELGGDRAREALTERRGRERDPDTIEALESALARMERPDSVEKLGAELEELRRRQRALEEQLEELGRRPR